MYRWTIYVIWIRIGSLQVFAYKHVNVFFFVCVCVCVCVRERASERESAHCACMRNSVRHSTVISGVYLPCWYLFNEYNKKISYTLWPQIWLPFSIFNARAVHNYEDVANIIPRWFQKAGKSNKSVFSLDFLVLNKNINVQNEQLAINESIDSIQIDIIDTMIDWDGRFHC